MRFALHLPTSTNSIQNIPLLLNTDLNTTISTLKRQNITRLVSILPTKLLNQDILNTLSCRSMPKLNNPTLIPLHKTCGYPIFEYRMYFQEHNYESTVQRVADAFADIGSKKNISQEELLNLQFKLLDTETGQGGSTDLSHQILTLLQNTTISTIELTKKLTEIINRDVVFNPSLGCVYFYPSDWVKDEYIFHKLMQTLLPYIYPQLHSFQTIEILRQSILNYRHFKITSKNKIALCPPFRNRCWTLCREPFNGTMKKKLVVKGEKTMVWDNRYLITSQHRNYKVRPLTADGLKQVVKKLSRQVGKNVEKIVNSLPPPTRELLPCIEMQDHIVSIPTLGVNLKDEFQAQYIPHLEKELIESELIKPN
ncbi:hypothetical protein HK103_005712 [Boothiomyces macroporosus]|uniref:Uncharacterized protein n=1 Tax=Boothiomyces macroporosus TaxID=261099 RepID=A0AAD5UJ01_9FUNG|nr:hypothetical protein HK103_005712 [Boothiomyces macroporosus]